MSSGHVISRDRRVKLEVFTIPEVLWNAGCPMSIASSTYRCLFHSWWLSLAWLIVICGPPLRAADSLGDVEQWGVFEVKLEGPKDGNPFRDVRLTATISNGAKSYEIEGFYDGQGIYRIRFMPDTLGQWHYTTAQQSCAAGRSARQFRRDCSQCKQSWAGTRSQHVSFRLCRWSTVSTAGHNLLRLGSSG